MGGKHKTKQTKKTGIDSFQNYSSPKSLYAHLHFPWGILFFIICRIFLMRLQNHCYIKKMLHVHF